jgi:(E)-4-hydroxy-3-methylbut-2-enyl-diphosphate synthase
MTLRLFVLQAHYRKPLDFTAAGLEAAASGWAGLRAALAVGHHPALAWPLDPLANPLAGGEPATGADPALAGEEADPLEVALNSAREHSGYLEELGFTNYVISLKSSDPNDVMDINLRAAEMFPEIPLHLGVTEAGMLPMGEIKTRIAFENLLLKGIGDTVRVSLTLPHAEKYKEIEVAKAIIADVHAGRFRSVPRFEQQGLNIISCPSCSRVENEAFVELAQKVREMTQEFADRHLTIAVMGCRVNGPGETDDADLGLWCAPSHVNLKRRGELVGQFSYEEIVSRLKQEIDSLTTSS